MQAGLTGRRVLPSDGPGRRQTQSERAAGLQAGWPEGG